MSWSRVSADYLGTTLAIRSDGTLWSWGRNDNGQLGLGDVVNRSSPVQVGTSSWIFVAIDTLTTAAIRADNTLWVWGDNDFGQVGDGTTIHRSSPVQVGVDSNWLYAVPYRQATRAIKTNTTAWAWGGNSDGGLGLGATTPFRLESPIQVLTTKYWRSISGGFFVG
jgi:alpha-tubulin suppressor-like RCC1 family protein